MLLQSFHLIQVKFTRWINLYWQWTLGSKLLINRYSFAVSSLLLYVWNHNINKNIWTKFAIIIMGLSIATLRIYILILIQVPKAKHMGICTKPFTPVLFFPFHIVSKKLLTLCWTCVVSVHFQKVKVTLQIVWT